MDDLPLARYLSVMDDCFQPTPPTDPLGEVLHMLRLTGTLYCRATMTAPWGIDMPRLVDSMIFVIVTAGRCVAEIEGEHISLSAGAMLLLPHGNSFRLLSEKGVPTTPLFDLPVERISERYELLSYGGGGEMSRAMAGVVQFEMWRGGAWSACCPGRSISMAGTSRWETGYKAPSG